MPRLVLLAVVIVALTGTMTSMCSAQESPRKVAFSRDIRPILSDRCYQCHGFDAQQRQAGLRLDTWEGLTTPLRGRAPVVPGKPEESELIRRITHTGTNEIMPPPHSGFTLKQDEIKLLKRWVAEGANFEAHWGFTPPKTFTPPAVAHSGWLRTDIDRFILRRLEQAGISPSEEAKRPQLLRRLSFDLTGLPPTPEEIQAFVDDQRPDAYEQQVKRLLGTPQFGERMALMWLDVARYADTNGFHHDNIRTAWPYRDWVIKAFNENLPYDQFVTHQLAGDLLPGGGDWETIASAFCRMHNINDEGGALDPEYRAIAIFDRVETVSTAFMGLTMTCARCHDHKYDPITQDDYYSLSAYFNNVNERGVYPQNFEQARAYPARFSYRPPENKAKFNVLSAALKKHQAAMASAGKSIASEVKAFDEGFRSTRGIQWRPAKLQSATAASGAKVEKKPDGSALLLGKAKASDSLTLTYEIQDAGLRLLRLDCLTDKSLPHKGVGKAINANAVLSHIKVTVESLEVPSRQQKVDFGWAWADHEQPNGDFDIHNALRPDRLGWALEGHLGKKQARTGLFWAKKPFGYHGGSRVTVKLVFNSIYSEHLVGRPRVSFASATSTESLAKDFPLSARPWYSAKPIKAKTFDPLFDNDDFAAKAKIIDLGRSGSPWTHRKDILDGKVLNLQGEVSSFHFARSLFAPTPRKVALYLGSDDAVKAYLNGKLVFKNRAFRGVTPDADKVVLELPAGESLLVVKVVNQGGPGGFYARHAEALGAPTKNAPLAFFLPKHRSKQQAKAFKTELSNAKSPTFRRLSSAEAKARAELEDLRKEDVPVVVMEELETPRKTFVLERGTYDQPNPKRPVTRRPPKVLNLPMPKGAPKNRLGFAQWLTHKDHPLTARVHVNRIWQMLFGVGLVKTSENFGFQAEAPSHPELLDWLARRFVESGWDQKRLLELILVSATYRQESTITDSMRNRDPENRLLGGFPRQRLCGEMVRDQALFVGGLLKDKIGGPSVRPYQPPGLWREVSIGGSSNTQTFTLGEGEDLYRRSLYTFWKRTSPNPQMSTFDAPSREFCVVARNTTNTPLQALVLWNDEQFLEAARVLAARTLKESEDVGQRIENLFLRCTGRSPSPKEHKSLATMLTHFRTRFDASPKDAAAFLMQGKAMMPKGIEAPVLAAWTVLANTVLASDAALVRN